MRLADLEQWYVWLELAVISDKMFTHLTEWNDKYVIIWRQGLAGPFQWVHPCQGDVWTQ